LPLSLFAAAAADYRHFHFDYFAFAMLILLPFAIIYADSPLPCHYFADID
jgi:hypothetical protein